MRYAILAATFSVAAAAASSQSELDKTAASNEAEATLLRTKLTKDVAERLAALQRLTELGRDASPALPELLACLEHANEEVRLHAALALGGLGKTAVKPLIQRLSRDEAPVRLYAAWALGLIGPQSAPASDALTKVLGDADDDVRRKAAFALGRLKLEHARPLPALVALLGDKNTDVVDAAATATVSFGSRAVPVLVVAVEKKAQGYIKAVVCLGDLGPIAAPAARMLGNLMEADGAAGDQAAIALGRIGKAALPELATRLKHTEKVVRQRTLKGLKPLGTDAVPCLLENASSKYDDVRLAVIHALAELRVNDRAAALAFVDALSDRVRAVRRAGIDSLARLGAAAAAPGFEALTHILLDVDAELRNEAKAALKILAHDPIPALRGMLKDKEIRHRIAAGETLAHLYGDKTGVSVLIEGVAHSDPPLRFQAAFGLAFARTESAKALPVLAQMQKSVEDATRGRALTALQQVAAVDEAAIPLLIVALQDTNSHIRYHAALWLGELGPKAKAALPALTKTLEDANHDVIFQAVWAIPKIGAPVESTWPGLKRLMAIEKTRSIAEYWLNQKGPEWEPLLVAGLEATEAPVRVTCVCALGNRRKAVPKAMVLMEKIALTDKNAEARRCGAGALTGIGDPAGKHIIACLRAEDVVVRDTAFNWLTYFERDPKPYLPGIIKLLKDDLPRARLAAAFTLEMLGPKARAALPALRPLLNDPDTAVRGRAAEAINRIDRKD